MQIGRTPLLLYYACIIFFFQQIILRMRYKEHIKSYFYCKRNLGLCNKANMLRNPCYVFPDKHTVVQWETRWPPCTAGPRWTCAPGSSPIALLLPKRHRVHKSLPSATSLPQCYCHGTLRGSPTANPFSGLSLTSFHMAAGSTSWAASSKLVRKLLPTFTHSAWCLSS